MIRAACALALLALACAPAARAVATLKVVGLFQDRAVLVIDGRQRLLRAGQTSPEGVTLIRADATEAVLEIDGERHRYGLDAGISSTFAPPPARATVPIAPDAAGMYFVDGSINGFAVRFLVDTGATTVAMNRHQARRLGLAYRLDGVEGTTSTASGIAKAYSLRLERVRVGDIELRDVAAVVIDGDHPTEVLLGNSFLGRVDMVREGRLLELRR